MLINRRYAWRGYGDNHQLPESQSASTFTASARDVVIGTLTLAVDSARGLAADAIFRDEIDRFRAARGARVCELTKLAFDVDVPSKPLLASLFHIIFIYGNRRHRCTDLFIEVNPRHRRYYEAMLGFMSIGDVRLNQAVGAPAQLMWLDIAMIRRRIDAVGGGIGSFEGSRSLYPFFFSQMEEDAIHARLVADHEAAAHQTLIPGVHFTLPDHGATAERSSLCG